jgi:hypothetical protein
VSVLSLQVFVSLMLVLGSVVLLLISVRLGDHEHGDRLTLMPLEDDDPTSDSKPPSTTTERDADDRGPDRRT